MTTLNGTYADCGYGKDFSIALWCSGVNCAAISDFPWMKCTNSSNTFHCTNGVDCSGAAANFTSVFTFLQADVNVSSSQQVSIDGKQFVVSQDTSGTVSAKATSGSSTARAPRLLLFVLVLISLLSGVMGQLSSAQIIEGIESKVPSKFRQYLPAIEGKICAWVEENIVVNTQGKTKELLQADFISYCVWVTDGIDSSPTIGEDEGHVRLLARFGNLWLCNKFASLIVSAQASEMESVALQHLCGDFILNINRNSTASTNQGNRRPHPDRCDSSTSRPDRSLLTSLRRLLPFRSLRFSYHFRRLFCTRSGRRCSRWILLPSRDCRHK